MPILAIAKLLHKILASLCSLAGRFESQTPWSQTPEDRFSHDAAQLASGRRCLTEEFCLNKKSAKQLQKVK